MATLTFRARVMDGREHLKSFQSGMRIAGYGELQYAWVREYQERGAVHYHFLWEREGLERRGHLRPEWLQEVKRRKGTRHLVRGPFEDLVVRTWMRAAGDSSPEFEDFQRGGIVELLGLTDSAARYFGSYMGKEKQKTLPDDAEKCGRWWFLCPGAKAVPVSKGHLTSWHKAIPLGTLFDKYECEASYTCADRSPVIPNHWKPRVS